MFQNMRLRIVHLQKGDNLAEQKVKASSPAEEEIALYQRTRLRLALLLRRWQCIRASV
jgi:hypothetical protein